MRIALGSLAIALGALFGVVVADAVGSSRGTPVAASRAPLAGLSPPGGSGTATRVLDTYALAWRHVELPPHAEVELTTVREDFGTISAGANVGTVVTTERVSFAWTGDAWRVARPDFERAAGDGIWISTLRDNLTWVHHAPVQALQGSSEWQTTPVRWPLQLAQALGDRIVASSGEDVGHVDVPAASPFLPPGHAFVGAARSMRVSIVVLDGMPSDLTYCWANDQTPAISVRIAWAVQRDGRVLPDRLASTTWNSLGVPATHTTHVLGWTLHDDASHVGLHVTGGVVVDLRSGGSVNYENMDPDGSGSTWMHPGNADAVLADLATRQRRVSLNSQSSRDDKEVAWAYMPEGWEPASADSARSAAVRKAPPRAQEPSGRRKRQEAAPTERGSTLWMLVGLALVLCGAVWLWRLWRSRVVPSADAEAPPP